MTQLGDPWAPIAPVAPDFIWYGSGGTLFSNLSYSVAGNVYPPTTDVYYSGDHSRYQAPATPLGSVVFFDAVNSIGFSNVVQTIIPPGVTVVFYQWDFGNGLTAIGAVASTTYVVGAPDVSTKLTIIDSLGRSRSVFHNMNLQGTPQSGGSIRVSQGTGRIT